MNNFKKLSCLFLPVCIFFANLAFAETLDWEDCIRYTKEHNPKLKILQEKINQAETNIFITKKNLATNIDFSIGSSVNQDEKSTNSYNLSVKKTIFDNNKNNYTLKGLEKTLMSVKSSFNETSSEIRYKLRLAFINLFYAQESLKLAEDITQIRRNNYELVQMNFASGLENRGSVLLSEAQLLEAETAVKEAKLEIIKMQKNLANIMGDIKYSSFNVKSSFELKENPQNKPMPDFQKILENNPTIKTLQFQKESSEFNLKLESLKITPSLAVSATAGQSDHSFITNKDLSHSMGISLSIPIFEGNIRKDKINFAKSEYNQVELNILSAKNEILNSLNEKWLDFQTSIYNVNTKNKFLEAYIKRSEITKAKYSIGLVTFDNWTIIEDNLINAKKAYLQAQIDTLKKEAEWIQIKGGNLDYE